MMPAQDYANSILSFFIHHSSFPEGRNLDTSLPKCASSRTMLLLTLARCGSAKSRTVSTPPVIRLMSACSRSYSKSFTLRTPFIMKPASSRRAKSTVRSE